MHAVRVPRNKHDDQHYYRDQTRDDEKSETKPGDLRLRRILVERVARRLLRFPSHHSIVHRRVR
jgi:hypothetical protein